MKDFTLNAYAGYLKSLSKNTSRFLRFDEYISGIARPPAFCLIRHDVDRKPENALQMATLEHSMNIKATYYFRTKPHTFHPEIIKNISALGHEIGYHYESLSDSDGNMEMAVKDFERNLKKLREIVPVKTCSMHGRPLKPFDNRDIWRIKENHQHLKHGLELLGEVYLDIDYSDIAYINDTGRNWTSGKANRRDKVNSGVSADFESGDQLLKYLSHRPHPKICFQVHPERWSNDPVEWTIQWGKDKAINLAKIILSLRKKS